MMCRNRWPLLAAYLVAIGGCAPPHGTAPAAADGATLVLPAALSASSRTADQAESRPQAPNKSRMAYAGSVSGPFAGVSPPSVASTGERAIVLGESGGSTRSLAYAELDGAGQPAGPPVPVPGLAVHSAAYCGGSLYALVQTDPTRTDWLELGARGALAARRPLAIPPRPWVSMQVVCVRGQPWLVGASTVVGASTLWLARVTNGALGSPSEWTYAEPTWGGSTIVHGDDLVILRPFGVGKAALLQIRDGKLLRETMLGDDTAPEARAANAGGRLVVVTGVHGTDHHALAVRSYDWTFASAGEAQEIATVRGSEHLGTYSLYPRSDGRLAVSYFTQTLSDDFVELPGGRSEPAVHTAQFVVLYDAVGGSSGEPLPVPDVGALGSAGWAGDTLLVVGGRFSSTIARYRLEP